MTFELSAAWLTGAKKTSTDELEATLASVRIKVGGKNVTEYVTTSERSSRAWINEQPVGKLVIPTYFIAEWIAENWWPLLYEPRKAEDDHQADAEYDSRHAMLSAEHGFALPNVRIEPGGSELITVACKNRDVPLAGVKFKNSASAVMPRDVVQAALTAFVTASVNQMAAQGISETPLQKAWKCVEDTSREQEVFCQLVGALGISPYSVGDTVSRAVDNVYDCLGQKAALDGCMASTADELISSEASIFWLAQELKGPHNVDLSPVLDMRLSKDKSYQPPWRRGYSDASRVRNHLGIVESDPLGAEKFFDKLKIDIGNVSFSNSDDMTLLAGVDRDENCASVVLTQSQKEARRFSACRAFFLAMMSGTKDRRLVTRAASRDQQASRAFAAELLVPAKFINSRSPNQRMSREMAAQIARERRVSYEAVKHQIENNGILLVA